MAKLIDITGKALSGEWGTDDESGDGIPVLRTTNFTNEGVVNYNDVVTRTITKKNIDEKFLRKGDIIIEKSGGSPTQSTGRVSLVSQELLDHAGAVICSNFCTAFRVKKGWIPLYVYYYLQFIYNLGAFFNFEGKTSGIKNLQLDAAFAAIPIEDISESIQNNIVAILQGLERKIAINRQINQNLRAR